MDRRIYSRYKMSGLVGPNQKNKCVSGHGSENFRLGRHTYFFNCFFFFWKEILFYAF